MAVRGLLPVRRQVPVIGDVVVIENHHARQMRHRPCHAAQAGGKRLDQLLFPGVALDFPVFQLRPAGFDQGRGVGDQTSRYIAMTSAVVTRWLSAVLLVNTGLLVPPKKRSRSVSLLFRAGSRSARW